MITFNNAMGAALHCVSLWEKKNFLSAVTLIRDEAKDEIHFPELISFNDELLHGIELFSNGSQESNQRVIAYKSILTGATYKKITERIKGWFGDNIKAKVFLRSDLYNAKALQFVDASKMGAYRLELSWDVQSLYRLLVKRMANTGIKELEL